METNPPPNLKSTAAGHKEGSLAAAQARSGDMWSQHCQEPGVTSEPHWVWPKTQKCHLARNLSKGLLCR